MGNRDGTPRAIDFSCRRCNASPGEQCRDDDRKRWIADNPDAPTLTYSHRERHDDRKRWIADKAHAARWLLTRIYELSEAKPRVRLVGEDLQRCRRAARRARWSKEEIDAFTAEATAGDYDNLLRTALAHFEDVG